MTQSQTGSNSNSSSQTATGTATTDQSNTNGGPGGGSIDCTRCFNGDVEQSNEADTSAEAENGNETEQGNDQAQSAGGGDTEGAGAGDVVDQTQSGTNSNSTSPDRDVHGDHRPEQHYGGGQGGTITCDALLQRRRRAVERGRHLG